MSILYLEQMPAGPAGGTHDVLSHGESGERGISVCLFLFSSVISTSPAYIAHRPVADAERRTVVRTHCKSHC
jgi:hypothetical protein